MKPSSTAGAARAARAVVAPPLRVVRSRRVLIVSNRLPMTVRVDRGAVRLSSSGGGLATGLRAVQANMSARCIGWSGVAADLPYPTRREIARRLAEVGAVGVPLSEREVAGFYQRTANSVLWPLLHDELPEAAPDVADWATYRAVNARFADVVLRELRPGDRVWIHDYHFMLLPRLLRERRPDVPIGFFLHTPFPTVETLAQIPEAAALVDGVLGANVVGLHTRVDVERFAEAACAVLGRRVELAAGTGVVEDAGRPVCLHFTPMGVDVAGFTARAADARVARRVAALRAAGGPLFVGVDRLDPTKGIPERLEAFGRLLGARPELRGRARLVQLAVPSREDVPAYRALRTRVETMVDDLNARFGTGAWAPIEYVYASVDEIELAALYRAADVMLVTPLRDGMNLVAKEFVASRTDHDGVLVLSEHAGAAVELTAALLADPRDVEGLPQAYAAALEIPLAERRVRMRRLRARVRAHDVRRWADDCLRELDAVHRMVPYPAS